MPRPYRQFLPLCACAIALVGCGGAEEELDRPATQPVTGVVTLGGKPVAGAQVQFYSTAGGEAAHNAFGRTDPEGRYNLTTFENDDGAVAGSYIVTVKKFDTPPPPQEEQEVSMENYVPPTAQSQAAEAPPKNELPAQYANRQSTPLKVTVNEGDNEIPLKLSE